jgi:hypothetical protein
LASPRIELATLDGNLMVGVNAFVKNLAAIRAQKKTPSILRSAGPYIFAT